MPNKNKIVGELEVIIKKMYEEGDSAYSIGQKTKVAKETIKSWANKKGLVFNKKINSKIEKLRPQVIEMLLMNKSRKEIQKTLRVHYTQVTKIAVEEGIAHLLKSRQEAALKKTLTEEEIKLKITDDSTYIGYNIKNKKYAFKCSKTQQIFFKSSEHIKDISSPFGKSGYALTESDFSERLKKIDHTIEPGTFTKTKESVIVYCSKGHKRELLKASYAFKFDCSVCSNNGTSKPEIELFEWIKNYYPMTTKFKFPERKTKPKEIDIFIPELNLGIEYCGLYYHQEKLDNMDENKHYKKMLEANKLKIRLITIFSDEWISRKDQIKNFLLSAINKNNIKIGARKCEIKMISKEVCDEFMEKNHIQGKDNSFVCFGLFHNQLLVGAITGGNHPHRHAKNNKSIYLNRLAFKDNVTIMGGASKLFSALVEYSRNNKKENIISWSDNRWSEGNVYKKLGFIFESEKNKGQSRGLSDGSIWPDFHCILKNKRYSRHSIKKMGLNELELNKIYDCGKKRWIYNL